MPKGIKGFLKGRVRTGGKRKGTPTSEETKRKISAARKGQPGLVGSNNPMYGMFGSKNPNWKGGKVKNAGYVLIYNPTHPFCSLNGYVLEHRLVMEKHLGRTLLPTEVVHHINSVVDDNRIENLMLFSSPGQHTKYHKLHE